MHLVDYESRNFTSRASETIKNKQTIIATTVYFENKILIFWTIQSFLWHSIHKTQEQILKNSRFSY